MFGLSILNHTKCTPERGPYLVNRNRARQLGIKLDDALFLIDELIDKSLALRP